jgi:hypothetical protein
MTAPDLALADTDPAAFVLAVADLRERIAADVATDTCVIDPRRAFARLCAYETDPRHIAAEVALWREMIDFGVRDGRLMDRVVAAAKAYLGGAP